MTIKWLSSPTSLSIVVVVQRSSETANSLTIRKPGNQESSKPAFSCLPALLICLNGYESSSLADSRRHRA